jgi:GT2 family glycosyltransferase
MIAVTEIGLQNAPHMSMTPTRQATVATIVIADGSGALDDTITAVERQVYEAEDPQVVGAGGGIDPAVPLTIAEAIDRVPRATEYVWIVREGALPVPDTLSALVRDADRTGAGMIGSKVVGDDEALLSVGLITDVFGVPYTGLDSAERDQGQYDVVRDVAAVAGISTLIRRDLLSGLRGMDPELAPLSGAIDLAQRARLKGARVMVSPASEVRFVGSETGSDRWREEAGRIRSIAKTYGPLTLVWVLPLDFLVGLFEVVVSMFFGRWYAFDLARAWGWNVANLPGTLSGRSEARRNRLVGDTELFRFQRKGSVKVSALGQRTLEGLRRRLPGDDTLSVESIGRDVRQPAFIIGILAVAFVALAARTLWSHGLPAVGYSLPFPVHGWDALAAYAGGWNPAGLGTPETLRPLVAISGLAKVVTFDAATISEYLLGAGAMLLGIWGITRMLRRWSIGAAPGLVAGVVYVAGPTAQGIAGNTHIGTLLGLGVLPWAIRFCFAPLEDRLRPSIGRIAGAVVVFGILGAAAPLLLLIPVPALAVYALLRPRDATAWRALILALAGTAGGALLLSPWIWDHSFEAIIRAGYAYWQVSPVVIVAAGIVVISGVVAAVFPLGIVAGWGGLMAGAGLFISRAGSSGVGAEAESAGLALAGLGLAVVVGVVAETVSNTEVVRWRRFLAGVGSVGIVVLLTAASVILLGGRIGLPGDRFTEILAFTNANPGEAERSRVLLVGPADLMPGDSRTLDGAAYRVVSPPVPDLGEPRLSPMRELDDYLAERLAVIVSGETRSAGGELAPFGIRWIVVLGDSEGSDADPESLAWRQVFAGQLDLLSLSAGVSNAVFVTDVDPVGRALTATDSWPRVGWVYRGDPLPGRSVFVAENPDSRFGPEPWQATGFANEVSSDAGVVTYRADAGKRWQAIAVAISVLALVGLAWWGRRAR